jgi:hypothetical protein
MEKAIMLRCGGVEASATIGMRAPAYAIAIRKPWHWRSPRICKAQVLPQPAIANAYANLRHGGEWVLFPCVGNVAGSWGLAWAVVSAGALGWAANVTASAKQKTKTEVAALLLGALAKARVYRD